MYYLGKHKGSPDDKYTHSSTVWEHFTKDNIPEGVTREIIAEGTDEEMCVLEHELLKFEKENGNWDRYYNESLGDPHYVDQSGENNPMYGRGHLISGKNNGMYGKGHLVTGKSNPFYGKKHSSETLKKMSEKKTGENHPFYGKKRPEMSGENHPMYGRGHLLTGENNPNWKGGITVNDPVAYKKKYDAERYARKKAERQGVGTLEPYL